MSGVSELPETVTISKQQLIAIQTLVAGAHALQKTGLLPLHEAEGLSIAVRSFAPPRPESGSPPGGKQDVSRIIDPNALDIKQT